MRKTILLLIAAMLLTACTSPSEVDFKSTVPALDERMSGNIDQSEHQFNIPSEINLNIPFFSQAPDADWSMPWQEACEESAVLLAYYYVTDQSPTKEQFKLDVQTLVDWQIENYGDYEHTNIEQTAKMLKEVFKFSNFRVLTNPSIEDIKKELSKGHPIVAPFAGRQLGNPFYSGEGPYYHMMVIKGYDEKHFITNDVGTKRGENFIYPYQTIMSAMHEWHDTDINLGAKKVIVLF